MKKTKTIGLLALMLLAVLAASGLGSAYDGTRPPSENRDAMRHALETGDYDAWKTAVTEGGCGEKFAENMSEDRFNALVEKYPEMAEKREAMKETHEQIKAALESGDYDAWQEAISGLEKTPQFAEKITDENFDVFVELHQAKQNGDYETAKELAGELGFEGGFKEGQHRRVGGFRNRMMHR
ncbi:MAG TPA: hypothetical protein ENH13_02180 [Euryarchaeota archaeon]|nr:hypothetical protein BMS3Bbin16_00757 [archaeon BMS3Bbin16]HDH27923.1 hypothetical protein [Euryarchaeota archaeon]